MVDRRNMKGFGGRLKVAREGFTQVEASKILGISQQQVSRYERDMDMPSAFNLAEIAIQFDVSIDWLLFGVGRRRM